MRSLSFLLFLIVLACLGPASVASSESKPDTPQWIWLSSQRDAETRGVMRASVEVGEAVAAARLKITADFAHVRVRVDGKPVAELEAYDPPRTLDLRALLQQPGRHEISLELEGVDGPSAVAARLEWRTPNGGAGVLDTDATWRAADDAKAVVIGPVAAARWADNALPEVSPFAEYNQWKEALPEDGAEAGAARMGPLPEGFSLEPVRLAWPEEGSWIALALDPKGRVLIARETTGILRMTLSADGTAVERVEVVNDSLNECRGLLWHDGALFANANRSKGLYRLRDTTGDDQFDEVTLLQETVGNTGHGRNDLAVGPDGGLHAIHGDDVRVPAVAKILTRPEAGAPLELGHWLRTDTDGSFWEVRTRGLRNPFGIDFNSDGEAFTYDADNEGDVGLSFYRPTRINHLVSGANYGWHQEQGNTRSMPVWAPDSVPTNFDVGRGSPTAVKFGTRSSFPPPWRDGLFALDWAYGRIVFTQLMQRGASYYGSGTVFLEGRPLNVTDLDFDDKGDMLFLTGGRKTQSALYRVRYSGPARDASQGAQQKACEDHARRARAQRLVLEAWHGREHPDAVGVAWEFLGHPDPWLRNAARVALESQPVSAWRERALAARNDLLGLTSLLALARAGEDADRAAVLAIAAELEPRDWRRTEKLSLLRAVEWCLNGGAAGTATRDRLAGTFAAWLPDLDEPVNWEVARVLALLGAANAVPVGMERLANAADQPSMLHYLEVLSLARDGWRPEHREVYFQKLAHARRFSHGDRFMAGFFDGVIERALEHVVEEAERRRLTALCAEQPELVAEEIPVQPRPFVRAWTMADFTDNDLQVESQHDPRKGRVLYEAALCSRCHVAGSVGRPVGPDLTHVASRFSRRDLLRSIIEPSDVVAEVHRNVVIRPNNAGLVIGRIVRDDFRNSTLHVAVNPFEPGALTAINKADIAGYEESPVSPMPPGLLNTLSKSEIMNLLVWLEAQGVR